MRGAIVAQDQHSTMGIKPIETRAYGHRFRSRLEARWAVAFTEARIAWQYEIEGFDLPSGPYLPDFWLPQVSMWAEVKGSGFSLSELHKAHDLAKASGRPVLLLIGQPADWAYFAFEPDEVSGYRFLLADGTQVQAMDYGPFEADEYHLSEGRFYSNSGLCNRQDFPKPFEFYSLNCLKDHPAIQAALSARFEHGESPQ